MVRVKKITWIRTVGSLYGPNCRELNAMTTKEKKKKKEKQK